MSRPDLGRDDRDRIVWALDALSSDNAGERDAAGLTIVRVLSRLGLSGDDIIVPATNQHRRARLGPTDWPAMVRELIGIADVLPVGRRAALERFVSARKLSIEQRAWVRDLHRAYFDRREGSG